jgi:hypothetical protein
MSIDSQHGFVENFRHPFRNKNNMGVFLRNVQNLATFHFVTFIIFITDIETQSYKNEILKKICD